MTRMVWYGLFSEASAEGQGRESYANSDGTEQPWAEGSDPSGAVLLPTSDVAGSVFGKRSIVSPTTSPAIAAVPDRVG